MKCKIAFGDNLGKRDGFGGCGLETSRWTRKPLKTQPKTIITARFSKFLFRSDNNAASLRVGVCIRRDVRMVLPRAREAAGPSLPEREAALAICMCPLVHCVFELFASVAVCTRTLFSTSIHDFIVPPAT